MPTLVLVRRWGQQDAGSTVDVDDVTGEWLVKNSYASEDGSEDAARAGARAPGTDGADLRAGGDVSRGGGMQIVRGGRDGERAGHVEGAPRAGGPVYRTPAEREADAAAEKGQPRAQAERKAYGEEKAAPVQDAKSESKKAETKDAGGAKVDASKR